MRVNYKFYLSIAIVCVSVFLSCTKFLDSKPESAGVIPTELTHLQYMLNNEGHLNSNAQNMLLEIYADDHLLEEAAYNALVDFDKAMYTFAPHYLYEQAQINGTWSNPNAPVQIANMVLELVPKMQHQNPQEARVIKGTALFYRASTWYYQAQVYAPVYILGGNNNKPSIPIRKTSDINELSVRSTVKETYDNIIKDLVDAIGLLPKEREFKTQPDKAIVYGFLARVYLSMQEYEKAGRYADSSLQLKNTLINFNSLDSNRNITFEKLNEETLFYSTTRSNNSYHQGRGGYVHPELYSQYGDNDLRRVMFFNNRAGYPRFKGSYTELIAGTFMPGVCVDEMYLIRAESFARAGEVQKAMHDLNTLLITRWKAGTFVPFTAGSADEALDIILKERRKSLLMRGLRYTDLKRLNLEPRFAKTIVRTLGEGATQQTFTLPPNDKRYVFLFPQKVIEMTGMAQTER